MTPAPCPVCALPGGFHDRDVHASHTVPVECLTRGDRLDRATLARFDRVYPGLRDQLDAYVDEAFMYGGRP